MLRTYTLQHFKYMKAFCFLRAMHSKDFPKNANVGLQNSLI